ncbi:MAG: aminomethyl-transferring glycine dehydrogenase subunit GcvPA [Thermoprotei archaeon]|nr:aminomethyl-transferring glycine dehydrogenase subunit GcvPA [TACK group archaeon]
MKDEVGDPYSPLSDQDVRQMMNALGLGSLDELFRDVPYPTHEPRLPPRITEEELEAEIERLLADSPVERAATTGRYVPSAVDEIASRGELYTAYTSYQSELSQGMLQALFEYQSLVSELTGLDVVSSSLYDGGSALGEAALLAKRVTGRSSVLVARSVTPERLDVLKTYLFGADMETRLLPFDGRGEVERPAFQPDDVALVYVESPNYLGVVEEGLEDLVAWAHQGGALVAVGIDLPSLSVLRPPGELGADLAVGEGVGVHPYGSPSLGVLAGRKELMRDMPGKLVGATLDQEGRLAFALTLVTREQSIRREKATSNVTTDSALSAVQAAAYIALMGASGLADVLRGEVISLRAAEVWLEEVGLSRTFRGPELSALCLGRPGLDEAMRDLQVQVPVSRLSGMFPELKDNLRIGRFRGDPKKVLGGISQVLGGERS